MLLTDLIFSIIQHLGDLRSISRLLRTCKTYYDIYNKKHLTVSGIDRLLFQNETIRNNLSLDDLITSLKHHAKIKNSEMFDSIRYQNYTASHITINKVELILLL